jgi:predicted component of type VI protein secretion system
MRRARVLIGAASIAIGSTPIRRIAGRGVVPEQAELRPRVAAAVTVVVAVMLGLTGCSSTPPTTSPTPNLPGTLVAHGSLTLSGAISGTLAAMAQGQQNSCSSTGNTIQGAVQFGAGSDAVVVHFQGVPGTTNLPLPGASTPGATVVTVFTLSESASWVAAQFEATSGGQVTFSAATDGLISGSINATLAPVKGSVGSLHLQGHWTC